MLKPEERSMNNISITAQIYYVKPNSDPFRCFAKVSLFDCVHINSISIQPDKYEPDKLFVSMPARAPLYKNEYIELPNRSTNPLWLAIEQVCLEAYKKYEDRHQTGEPTSSTVLVELSKVATFKPINTRQDVVVEDISDEPINLDDIPF